MFKNTKQTIITILIILAIIIAINLAYAFVSFENTQNNFLYSDIYTKEIINSSYWYLKISIIIFFILTIISLIYSLYQVAENHLKNKKIEEYRQILLQLVDSTPEAIAIFDNDDRLIISNKTYCNIVKIDENSNGMTFHDICINSVDNKIYKDKKLNNYDWVAKYIENIAHNKPYICQLKTGKWIEISNRKISEVGILSVIRDITATIEIEDKLRKALNLSQEATKIKSDFLAMMSHEIRTPLNGVIGILGILLRTNLTNEQRNYILTASEAGNILLSIIENILNFSKIKAGKMILEDSNFSPYNALQHVTELLAPIAYEKGIDIACFIDPSLPLLLRGDQDKLRQILFNLAGNAVKFTNHGGVSIELHMASKNDVDIMLTGSVADTGIGITYGKQNLLFDEFNQLDASYSRRFGGTGLGLTITKALVKAMGGTISINSEPDHGSIFSFNIKLAKNKDSFHNKKIQLKSILFLSQNSATSYIIRKQIQADGHKVISVNNKNEALTIIQTNDIDIIVIDNQPNDDKNIEITSDINKQYNQIPILFLIANYKNKIDKKQLFKNSLINILQKPVSISSLRNFIDNPRMVNNDNNLYNHRDNDNKLDHIGIGKNVLLAEDSKTNSIIAVSILRNAGFSVDWVKNGMEAVESIKHRDYDLVLMDISMSNMDGIEATSAIRKLKGEKGKIPIIALTAHVMPDDKSEFIAHGMDGYLAKPLDSKNMLSTIEKYLSPSIYNNKPAKNNKKINDEDPIKYNETTYIPICDSSIIKQLKNDIGSDALNNLLDIFLTETKERITLINKYFNKNNINAIANEAHALKSSAGSFGALKLQFNASNMEKYANKKQMEELDKSIKAINSLCDETLNIYTQMKLS